MYEIVYDRNFREDKERYKEWSQGQEVPDIAPHRIIELNVEGAEATHLEQLLGIKQRNFYGDVARSVFLNLAREYDERENNTRSSK